MTQAQAAQQLVLAQQGSGALSGGAAQQSPHGSALPTSMGAAPDRAHSGALLLPPLDDAALRSSGGGMAQQQQALSGGGGVGTRRTSQECGSPAPFGNASPSHSGTGNTRRGGGYQGECQIHLKLGATDPCNRQVLPNKRSIDDCSPVSPLLVTRTNGRDRGRQQRVCNYRALTVAITLQSLTACLQASSQTDAHRPFAGEPEVSSLGPGGSGGGGGPGSVTSGGGPSEANAGPRIFVGKLTKGTTEEDVKQYFTRCASSSSVAANPRSAEDRCG